MLLHYGLVFPFVLKLCLFSLLSSRNVRAHCQLRLRRVRPDSVGRSTTVPFCRRSPAEIRKLDRWIDIGSTLDRHWIDMNKTKLVSGLARKRIQWKLISYVSCSLSDENRNVNGMYLVLGFFLRMESWSLERKSAWKNSESAVCLRAPLFWAWNLMHPKAKKQNSHATPKGTAPQSKVNLKKQMENQFC